MQTAKGTPLIPGQHLPPLSDAQYLKLVCHIVEELELLNETWEKTNILPLPFSLEWINLFMKHLEKNLSRGRCLVENFRSNS